jgi:GNAT superfamily N-acetyltransferase
LIGSQQQCNDNPAGGHLLSYTIRALDPLRESEIVLVASRMRDTLVEVLGKTQGEAMYSLEWLEERVRFHLDPLRSAKVFLAEYERQIVGQTIVRAEGEAGEAYGLFSTIFVVPEHRRHGVARLLLSQGESWMREQGLHRAATNTAHDNQKLIRILETLGYSIALRADPMVHLSRQL